MLEQVVAIVLVEDSLDSIWTVDVAMETYFVESAKIFKNSLVHQ